ncbi:phage tail protein [Pseudomonas sp. RW409]|uniref:phage tail protein n=1 Tax=Pseudomonas sp. RW409 TaxID=2202895 RepID=UPI000D73939C|nr:phage tail protein [Pseudomonas sp. RW409]PWY40584.1 phage tail protein [Pseudomonas sp. RW409]
MADYYTLLTNAGIAYETACKAAGVPIKLSQISVGDGGGAVYNPAATDTALKREVWRGPLNALFQDEKNPSWLLAEVTIPPEVGGWYVREAGLWTDTGILYAIVKYPESFKPVLATSGSGKEFYIRSIFETSNASLVTLLIDDTVVKATRAWVAGYVADELAKLDSKQSVRVATTTNIVLSGAQAIDGVAVVDGDRVLVKAQSLARDNGIYVVANGAWTRSKDADASVKVTSGLIVSVEEGALLADTIWQLVTDGSIVLDTTALTFQNITKGFAPLNSPVLIDPTANTPVQFNNSKALATTEFVQRSLGSKAGVRIIDASVELTAAEAGFVILANILASNGVLTLPAFSTVRAGVSFYIQCGAATNAISVRAPAGMAFGAPLAGADPSSVTIQPGSAIEFIYLSASTILATNGAGTAQLTSNGFQKLPSGLILQWGSAVSVGSATGNWSATFPIGFPNACIGASILGNGGPTVFSLVSKATNGLTATAMLSTTGAATANLGGFFFAEGY